MDCYRGTTHIASAWPCVRFNGAAMLQQRIGSAYFSVLKMSRSAHTLLILIPRGAGGFNVFLFYFQSKVLCVCRHPDSMSSLLSFAQLSLSSVKIR